MERARPTRSVHQSPAIKGYEVEGVVRPPRQFVETLAL